ncbi:MAG: hypothetical protein ABI697_08095 [Devosia sp.]
MSPPTAQTAALAPTSSRKPASRPFLGLIDAVLVDGPGAFVFDGSIGREQAAAAWTWMLRDVAGDLIDPGVTETEPAHVEAVLALTPELVARASKHLEIAAATPESARRLRTQLGSEEAMERLPVVVSALKFRDRIDQAQEFGRSANAMADESQLALALQSMPFNDRSVAALLLHAAVGQVSNPSRMITAAIRLAGSAEEAVLQRAGTGVIVEAMFAHAQGQIAVLNPLGVFGDVDLLCRAVDRFHRLMRSVTGYVELNRGSRWSGIAAGLTKSVSARLEPRLRDVAPDLNKALRRRDGVDRLDPDMVLSALNGMYVLAAVRDARDSLALNALFDQVWSHTGQALEIHIDRMFEQIRQDPSDQVSSKRLDAALKMAELRFGLDYADTLRRAKATAERRLNSA